VLKKHSEKLEVSGKNKLRRDSRREFFSREESTGNFTINEKDPFGGIKIFPDHEIWGSCTKDRLTFLRHFVYSELWKCLRSGIIEVPKR
jgi:hypothetical protein